MPDVRADYAGDIAWRGLIEEPDLPETAAALLRDRFSFFECPSSHMLVYLVPGAHEAVTLGPRRYNWVWYRNATEARRTDLLTDRDGRQRTSSAPPGLISAAAETDLRQAAVKDLPPPFRMLLDATDEPFLQSIEDLSVRRMAIGRIPHRRRGFHSAAAHGRQQVIEGETPVAIASGLPAFAGLPVVSAALVSFVPERRRCRK
jgi:hypothetical protein